jgi:fibronectin type 3 domain-containing protein
VGNILYYEDTNVTNGNTYYYVVSAINIVGEGFLSTEISTTPGTVPEVPTSLSANAGDTFVELTWNAPSSDGGSPIINYLIYRSSTSGSGFAWLGNPNDLNYNDTGLTNGVEYFYIVTARNAIGESPTSNEASDIPLGPPSSPGNVQAQSGESYVYISWDVPTSDGGSPITKYNIYRRTTSGALEYLDDVVGVLYFNDTTGSDGTEYFYKITAVNTIGESAQSSEVAGTSFAYPGVPLNVTALSGDTYIYITWDQPDSEGSSSITNYTIYKRSTSGGGTYLYEIGNVLFYNDTSVTTGVTYYYYVVAKNSEGAGAGSLEVSGKAISVPGKPENVVEDAGDSYVLLSWDVPDHNGGSEITGYRIYRGSESEGETLVAEIGNLLAYNDTSVTNGITYYYRITGVNAIGEGSRSNEILALPYKDTDGDNQPDHEDDDDDNDGLLDTEELDKGTNPLVKDSDGDGHNDKEDLFPLDSSKWQEEEPESSNLLLILLLILIIVVVLVLFLATRKKGKPKEETVPEGEKKELPPPPGKVKEEGSDGEQEDSTPGDEEPKEEEKLGAEEPEFEIESKEEAQDEISNEEPKVDESIEQESQEIATTREESTLDEPKE